MRGASVLSASFPTTSDWLRNLSLSHTASSDKIGITDMHKLQARSPWSREHSLADVHRSYSDRHEKDSSSKR